MIFGAGLKLGTPWKVRTIYINVMVNMIFSCPAHTIISITLDSSTDGRVNKNAKEPHE
jgi:hypothetical protein